MNGGRATQEKGPVERGEVYSGVDCIFSLTELIKGSGGLVGISLTPTFERSRPLSSG